MYREFGNILRRNNKPEKWMESGGYIPLKVSNLTHIVKNSLLVEVILIKTCSTRKHKLQISNQHVATQLGNNDLKYTGGGVLSSFKIVCFNTYFNDK